MAAVRPTVKVSKPRTEWGVDEPVIITITSEFGDELRITAYGDALHASVRGAGGPGSLPTVMLFGEMEVDDQR